MGHPAPLAPLPLPAAAAAGAPRARILLVSYHFPPGQAAGALRWQKLAGYAAERGWGIDAVTLHPDELPSPGPARAPELPPGTRVFGVRRPPPRGGAWAERAAGVRRWLRSLVQGPGEDGADHAAPPGSLEPELVLRGEMRRFPTGPGDLMRALRAYRFFAEEGEWARAAAEAASGVLRPGVHAAVVTCGPPHMVHPAGLELARRARLPFVMDLRDPWSLTRAVFRSHGSPLWYALAEHYERRAVRGAALVVTNTEPLRRAMQAAHPAAAERIVTVTNGCDAEPLPPAGSRSRFTVAYAGSIYLDRDPRPLFRAAARLVREDGLRPDRFGIAFLGSADRFGGVPLPALAEEEGVAEFVTVHPRRPRAEALEFLAGAAMLLSLPQGAELAIPSKVFEYMQFPAWILALAREGSATELLLRESGADVVDPDDVEGILRALRTRYREFRAGCRPAPLNADGRFSRRHQARILFDALERLVSDAPSPGTADAPPVRRQLP